jgi:hypothetical protein
VKLKSRTASYTVFATACFSRTRQVDGRSVSVPASQVHAKTMGTTTTLCGQSALSWFKFWDIPFVRVRADRCPRCTDVFQRRLAAGRGN